MPMPGAFRSNQWPPPAPAETEAQAALRQEQEKEAKRRNDEIDRMIELERQELKRRKPQAKLLLLGQAEAGKSTLLKNFQLHFAPTVFFAEAEAWRPVIHLNLVRAVNFILSVLSDAASPTGTPESSTRSITKLRDYHGRPAATLTADPLRSLRMRLSPLNQVELILEKRLCAEAPATRRRSSSEISRPRPADIAIHARSGWKSMARAMRPTSATSSGHDELHDARRIIEACRDDIVALWTDEIVHRGLKEKDIVLEDYCTYFLNHAMRITSGRYFPDVEDILRARLQTVGVEEHRLIMEKVDPGQEWIFYDVEGCRGKRAAWAPFFDDVNAVIFLCPMSNFDCMLREDPNMNSLLDSFQLWKTLCESRLLADATFILFLNKMDLLQAKLDSGIVFADFVTLYKDQPNDAECIAQYFKRKFSAVHKFSSPKQRPLHIHTSCAIDTKTMSTILGRVKDIILFTTLKETAMI